MTEGRAEVVLCMYRANLGAARGMVIQFGGAQNTAAGKGSNMYTILGCMSNTSSSPRSEIHQRKVTT